MAISDETAGAGRGGTGFFFGGALGRLFALIDGGVFGFGFGFGFAFDLVARPGFAADLRFLAAMGAIVDPLFALRMKNGFDSQLFVLIRCN